MSNRNRASALRARLFRPPNAVIDHGIDLGGKDAKAARIEVIRRTILDQISFDDEARKALSNFSKKVAK